MTANHEEGTARIELPPEDEAGKRPPTEKEIERAPATVRLPKPGGPAAAPVASPDAASGESLRSQYSIVEKIGDGGMGVVYLGQDRQLGRYVAIKRLHRNNLADPHVRERFFREAKAVAALNHIHIVHVYTLAEDEDGPYIVMEYVAGPRDASLNKVPPHPFTLADCVHSGGPLGVSEALNLLMKVCGAVEYAHSRGVIHRDLKPSNVLLNEHREPKLVDFGLARQLSSPDDRITVPGERMLSLGYGAPEQEADAGTADERADVYGLGGLIYFSVTGKNPRYFRENDLPEALRMPVAKALETNREKRWQNVGELREALSTVTAPSTIDLPPARTSWRCKWCDAINPVLIRFCGKCGWDGGEACPECGEATRFGVQYCGKCGADGREYAEALALLQMLEAYRDRRAFASIEGHAGRITGFKPAGPTGSKIVDTVMSLREAARSALSRVTRLKATIGVSMAEGNFELARQYIEELNSLSPEPLFQDELDRIPGLIMERNLERARGAIRERNWAYAKRTCAESLAEIAPDNMEARILLRKIWLHRFGGVLKGVAMAAMILFVLYVFGAAPVYRIAGRKHPRAFDRVYSLVGAMRETTPLKTLLTEYAELWGVGEMYENKGDQP